MAGVNKPSAQLEIVETLTTPAKISNSCDTEIGWFGVMVNTVREGKYIFVGLGLTSERCENNQRVSSDSINVTSADHGGFFRYDVLALISALGFFNGRNIIGTNARYCGVSLKSSLLISWLGLKQGNTSVTRGLCAERCNQRARPILCNVSDLLVWPWGSPTALVVVEDRGILITRPVGYAPKP
ncbi:hypothetical protein B0H19DRAFT_1071255 [Mycena capillaripes]|nr:hypothetical protein B0H19DRAFT_1071255 [Mycena capillaripes]